MPKEKRYLDTFDSAGRKKVPMYAGLMAYFPDACAAVAEHSYKGNEKHNPGEPLHHARGKSMDHTDCIVRHVAAGPEGMDGDSLDAVALAWRAMAYCQEVLERKYALTLPEGATDPRAFTETNSLVGPNGEQAPRELASGGIIKGIPDSFKKPVTTLTGVTGAPLDFNPGMFPQNSRGSGPNDGGVPHKKRDVADQIQTHVNSYVPDKGPWPDLDPECIPGN